MTEIPTHSSLRHEIRADLAAAGCAAQRRFGQHFMVDPKALAILHSELAPDDRVLEVGPGTGILTKRLLAGGTQVLAAELDHGLAAFLQERYAPFIRSGAFELVEGDALDGKNSLHPRLIEWTNLAPWHLRSNLPYDASLPIILDALALPNPPKSLIVTIQREAAERLVSAPGSDVWGATAAVAQAAGSGRILKKLSPGSFDPPPRVDSAILSWTPTTVLPAKFGVFCKAIFAYRRKMVRGALRDIGLEAEQILAAIAASGCNPETRVEALSVVQLLALHTTWRQGTK